MPEDSKNLCILDSILWYKSLKCELSSVPVTSERFTIGSDGKRVKCAVA